MRLELSVKLDETAWAWWNGALAICFQLGDIEVFAIQLVEDDLRRLLFTHRQMGELVGKSFASAQKFCKEHEQELPPPVTAIVPDKPRPVALSSWEAAVAYWTHQAAAGNATAVALVEAARHNPENELQIEVVSKASASDSSKPKDIEAAIAALPSGDDLPNTDSLRLLFEGLSLICKWMESAGITSVAIASWKLNVLSEKFPALASAAASAQKLLGQNDPASPTGMIASQVAQQVSEQLGRSVSAAQINAALHEARNSGVGAHLVQGSGS